MPIVPRNLSIGWRNAKAPARYGWKRVSATVAQRAPGQVYDAAGKSPSEHRLSRSTKKTVCAHPEPRFVLGRPRTSNDSHHRLGIEPTRENSTQAVVDVGHSEIMI